MFRVAWLALLVGLSSSARAQFGQNHVVMRDFQWKVRSTEHFDIYYYPETEPLVPEAAEILETAFAKVTKELDIQTDPPPWLPEKEREKRKWERRPFFLYASPNEFEQSNIAIVGDGTGGITEPFKNRFMVYNDGTRKWLEDVITHEFTHIMQFYVLVSGWWKSGELIKTIVYPLWMMEGMADHSSYSIDAYLHEITVRDAATSNGLIPLYKLEHFGHLKPHQITLAYEEGSAAMEFLATQYGWRKVGDMLRLFTTRLETGQVLHDLIGIDEMEFDRRFREYMQEKYEHEVKVQRLSEPDVFGPALTRVTDDIPQFNVAPVATPDGKTLYYLSTRHGEPPELRELDVRTKRSRRVAPLPWARVENLPFGNFANIDRALSLSPDGRYVAFIGTRNHQDSIYLYDRVSRRTLREAVPGFEQLMQPAFSPDGKAIAFSGMKRSTTDLYLYHLDSGKIERLTDDARDDEMPAFTPDGKSIVFSGERLDAVDPHGTERRLYRLDLADRSQTLLEETGGEARDPVVSADGRRVLFIRQTDGNSEVCELELSSGKAVRMTRTIGGTFTPAYVGDGVAFASLRRGSVQVHLGERSAFLAEELPRVPRRAPGDVEFALPGMGGVRPSTTTVALSEERPYKFTYSTDLFIPAFFYSSPGGFYWTSYWQGSDLLGNHVQTALVDFHNEKTYDYQAAYAYSRFRPQLVAGFTGSGREDLLDLDTGHDINDAYNAQYLEADYPLDRYHRLEAQLFSATERVDDLTDGSLTARREARAGSVAFVRDTVRGRYLVATQGNRLRASYTREFAALGGNQLFDLVSLEGHQFFELASQTTLAFRAVGMKTVGRDSPQLILGGWGGVRGYGRSTTTDVGDRLAVLNTEFRFPIAPDLNYYMWYFFPDFYFKAIFGDLFTDTGYVWDNSSELDRARWGQLRNSVGLGVRVYSFILQEFPLILAFDYAHRTTSNGGVFYVNLSQLF